MAKLPDAAVKQRLAQRRVEPFLLTVTSYAGGARLEPHTHGFSKISLFLAGGAIESCGRSEQTCAATTVLIKPAGLEHRDCFGPAGARVFSLSYDGSGQRDDGDWTCACRGYRALDAGPVGRALARVWACWIQGAADEELEGHAWYAVELAAGLDTKPRADSRGCVRRVTERLRHSVAEPISISRLAAEVGAHPVWLARVFRKRHGCSMREYLHGLRVRRAADLLDRTDASLADIALDSGFCDQPHLSRVFKNHLGITPADYRKRVR